jgi:signal transduction histidine kinase
VSTTYGIITRSGGTIRCEGESGRGATFYVYLPVADDD